MDGIVFPSGFSFQLDNDKQQAFSTCTKIFRLVYKATRFCLCVQHAMATTKFASTEYALK